MNPDVGSLHRHYPLSDWAEIRTQQLQRPTILLQGLSRARLITDLRTSALTLKGKGVSAADAGKQLTTEFKAKYPDWPSMNVTGFVRSIYAE